MNKKITVFCILLLTVCLSVTVLGVRGAKTPSNLSTATAGVRYADADGDGFDDDAFDFNIDDIFTTRAPSGSTTKSNLQESVSNAAGSLASEVGDKVTNKQEEISKNAGTIIGAVSNFFGDEAVGNMSENFSHYVSDFRGNIGGGSSSSSGGLFGGLLDRIRNIGGGNNDTTYEATVYTPITPVVTGGSYGGSSYTTPNNNVTSAATPATPVSPAVPATASGDPVNFSSNVNPYTKPSGSFQPGDEDETIKWLQWIFVYTGSLPNAGVTGKLDDDTVAAVKTLQRKYGLTVDGAITPEVVKAAEQEFYAAVGTQSTVPAESDTVPVSEEPAPGDYHNNVGAIVLIICIAVIWCVALAAIVFILLYKKKKKAAKTAAKPAAAKPAAPDAPAEEKPATPAESGSMSLSDLFAEAGTKNDPKS